MTQPNVSLGIPVVPGTVRRGPEGELVFTKSSDTNPFTRTDHLLHDNLFAGIRLPGPGKIIEVRRLLFKKVLVFQYQEGDKTKRIRLT